MNVSGSNTRVERFRFLSFSEKDKQADAPAQTSAATETVSTLADALASVAAENTPPPPPTFSEEQLEQETMRRARMMRGRFMVDF